LRAVEEAVAEFQKAVALSGDNSVYVAALSHAYALGGNKDEAVRLRIHLEEQKTYVSPYWMATLQTGLGEKDSAFDWLETAFRERSGGLAWLGIDLRFDSLRSDSRFSDLLRRIDSPR
jgi:hypothetical protein